MATAVRGSCGAWGLAGLVGMLLAAAMAPASTHASAATGSGGGASAPGPVVDARTADHQQRLRCQALLVAAVRSECLRQADRDLARRLAPAASAAAAAPGASTPSARPGGGR